MKKITIAGISFDAMFGGTQPSDMEGIDTDASRDAYDAMLAKLVKEAYPDFDVQLSDGKTIVDSGDWDEDAEIEQAIGDIAQDLWNRQDGFWRFTEAVSE